MSLLLCLVITRDRNEISLQVHSHFYSLEERHLEDQAMIRLGGMFSRCPLVVPITRERNWVRLEVQDHSAYYFLHITRGRD